MNYATKQEGLAALNEALEAAGLPTMTEQDAIDFTIENDDDIHEIVIMIRDEEHENKCQKKDAWMYER